MAEEDCDPMPRQRRGDRRPVRTWIATGGALGLALGIVFAQALITNLGAAVNFAIFVVGGTATVQLIVGGILYVISSGDPQDVARARSLILYSIIAVVISIAVFVIAQFLGLATA